ncbi:MAG TPA: hemophore-related protein [Rhabdochlamydiaceae bacterium]|nr:hemophore-related protein [Rhabdochlamydiaceae bacterium]
MLKFLTSLACVLATHAFCTPSQVILIRHGEKPAHGNYLNAKGWKRASALIDYFQNNPEVLNFGIPYAIFAAKPCHEDPCHREMQTISSLAQTIGTPILSTLCAKETAELAQFVLNNPKYEGKMVLICWDHYFMDQLSFDLGVHPKPPAYPDDRFDLTYIITYHDPESPTLCVWPQQLLEGDLPTVPFNGCR